VNSTALRESILVSGRQDTKELEFDDLQNDVDQENTLLSPQESNKQDFQSKIYDQILSMPID
jgi:hypothetical protein